MENLIFDGTDNCFVELNLCETTGPWKIDWIQIFDRLAYQFKEDIDNIISNYIHNKEMGNEYVRLTFFGKYLDNIHKLE